MLRVHEERTERKENSVEMSLDELAREGARRMIQAALEIEVEVYVSRFREERDEQGRAQVSRNGKARPRKLTVGSGTVEIRAPRVEDRRRVEGEKQKFTSRILPPYMRRSPQVSEVLPILYLRGLSSGDFQEALPPLLGEEAAGLSPSTITRLTKVWQEEYEAFGRRDLSDRDYVYLWADGVHFNVRLEEDRLCALVLVGVRPDGSKEVVAIEEGYRESKESWLSVLRDLKSRGMRAPLVAIGDRALGFWAAVREVWPETREESCWVHRMANVLAHLPKRLQPRARRALHEMMYAESRQACGAEMGCFEREYRAKYPKAVASLVKDRERLLTHFDFPAEHWKHLRTTNPIESSFATVKLRQRVTKGAGSRRAGLTMAFKLLQMAEGHWRSLDAGHLVAQVRAGIQFQDGLPVERADRLGQGAQATRKRLSKVAA